jgi:hypothetical protein
VVVQIIFDIRHDAVAFIITLESIHALSKLKLHFNSSVLDILSLNNKEWVVVVD